MAKKGWQTSLIKDFKGLVEIDSPDLIEQNELIKCVNFDVNTQGQLVKRPGLKKWAGPAPFSSSRFRPVFLLGYDTVPPRMYALQPNQDIYAAANTAELRIATDDSARFGTTGVANIKYDQPQIPNGISYGGKFYYVFGSVFYEFDPNTNANVIRQTGAYVMKCLIEHQDRPFAIRIGTDASTSGIIYGAPTGWLSGGFSVFIEVKHQDFNLSQIVSYKDKVVVFTAKSIRVLHTTGLPAEWSFRSVIDGLGANNYGAVCLGDELIYFIDSTGIYRTDLVSNEKISEPLDMVFKNRLSSQDGWIARMGYPGRFMDNLDVAQTIQETRNARDLVVYYKHKLYCRIVVGWSVIPSTPDPASAETYSRVVYKYRWFVFNTLNSTWTEYKFNIPNIEQEPGWDIKVFDSYQSGTIPNGVYISGLGSVDSIHRFVVQDYQETDDAPFKSSFRTKNFDFTDISRVKRVFSFNTYYSSQSTVNVTTDADARVRKLPRTGDFSRLYLSPGFTVPTQSFYLDYEDENNKGNLTVESIEMQLKLGRDQTIKNKKVHTRL